MLPTIQSKILGTLTRDEKFDDWWYGPEIEIPFFGRKKLQVIFTHFTPEDDPHFIEDADAALENFLKLDLEYRKYVSGNVYVNCRNFFYDCGIKYADEWFFELKDEHDIWDHVTNGAIYVERRIYGDKCIYVSWSGGCDWEKEHGLFLSFKQGGRLTRVSQFDGHVTDADAYGKPDEKDQLLSRPVIEKPKIVRREDVFGKKEEEEEEEEDDDDDDEPDFNAPDEKDEKPVKKSRWKFWKR